MTTTGTGEQPQQPPLEAPPSGPNTNEGRTPAFEDILTESLGESFNLPKELMTASRSVTEYVPRGRITAGMVPLIVQLACEESLAERGYIERETVLWWIFNATLAIEGAARQEAVASIGAGGGMRGAVGGFMNGIRNKFGQQSAKAV